MRLPTKSELTLSIFSIFFTLVLCEWAAHYWFDNMATADDLKKYGLFHQIPANQWRIQRHHYLNYSLTPGFTRDKLSHNSKGFRGKEFEKEKADSVFRIVCLGGSTTYTELVNDNEKTYPALLEKIIRDSFNYQNIEVINAGVPGYNSWESLINLEFRVLDLNPDLVVVYHGTNDVHPRLIPPNKYRSDNSGKRRDWEYPEPDFWDRSALLRIIRRQQGYSKQIWLGGLTTWHFGELGEEKTTILDKNPPVYYERNLKSMVGLAKVHGFKIMLATWAYSPHKNDYAATPAYRKGFQECNEVVKKIGQELSVPVYNFDVEMPQKADFWGDGRHLNEKGAALKARLFANFIIEKQLIGSEN